MRTSYQFDQVSIPVVRIGDLYYMALDGLAQVLLVDLEALAMRCTDHLIYDILVDPSLGQDVQGGWIPVRNALGLITELPRTESGLDDNHWASVRAEFYGKLFEHFYGRRLAFLEARYTESMKLQRDIDQLETRIARDRDRIGELQLRLSSHRLTGMADKLDPPVLCT